MASATTQAYSNRPNHITPRVPPSVSSTTTSLANRRSSLASLPEYPASAQAYTSAGQANQKRRKSVQVDPVLTSSLTALQLNQDLREAFGSAFDTFDLIGSANPDSVPTAAPPTTLAHALAGTGDLTDLQRRYQLLDGDTAATLTGSRTAAAQSHPQIQDIFKFGGSPVAANTGQSDLNSTLPTFASDSFDQVNLEASLGLSASPSTKHSTSAEPGSSATATSFNSNSVRSLTDQSNSNLDEANDVLRDMTEATTFAFPHSMKHDNGGSPASSYAPSTHGRHGSLAMAAGKPFKFEPNMDRRLSSPAIIGNSQHMYERAQGLPSGVPDSTDAQWTPNFSFGAPTGSENGSLSTAHGEFVMPESRRSSENSSIDPQSIASSAGVMRRPSTAAQGNTPFAKQFNASISGMSNNFNFDRRMSVPVMGTNIMPYSPGQTLNMSNASQRQRQASAVDWKQFHRPADVPSWNRDDQFWDTLDSARGMLQMSQPDKYDPHGNDALKAQLLARRRQSMPFIGSNDGRMQPPAMPGTLDNAAGLFAGAGGFGAGSDLLGGAGGAGMQPTLGIMPEVLGGLPNQASMMSTFNSKDSDSNQKKHVCPVCKKRFTRPSSLTTHIYSHTGEKPFICEYENCGRHFSVISNLRRHRKIHKAGGIPPMDK